MKHFFLLVLGLLTIFNFVENVQGGGESFTLPSSSFISSAMSSSKQISSVPKPSGSIFSSPNPSSEFTSSLSSVSAPSSQFPAPIQFCPVCPLGSINSNCPCPVGKIKVTQTAFWIFPISYCCRVENMPVAP